MSIQYDFIEKTLCGVFANGGKILDLGAGDGVYQYSLPDSCQWFGVDISPRNDFIIKSQAENLPFPDGFFDGVFVVAGLHLMEKTVFSEVSRILKSGGTFVVFDYKKKVLIELQQKTGVRQSIWNVREIKRLLRMSGFSDIVRLSHSGRLKSIYREPIFLLKSILKSSWVILFAKKI